jgi:hypothetical protein
MRRLIMHSSGCTSIISSELQGFSSGISETPLPLDQGQVIWMYLGSPRLQVLSGGFFTPAEHGFINRVILLSDIPSYGVHVEIELHGSRCERYPKVRFDVKFPNVIYFHGVPRLVPCPLVIEFPVKTESYKTRADRRSWRGIPKHKVDKESLGAFLKQRLEFRFIARRDKRRGRSSGLGKTLLLLENPFSMLLTPRFLFELSC